VRKKQPVFARYPVRLFAPRGEAFQTPLLTFQECFEINNLANGKVPEMLGIAAGKISGTYDVPTYPLRNFPEPLLKMIRTWIIHK
jgi:hypothetical protein